MLWLLKVDIAGYTWLCSAHCQILWLTIALSFGFPNTLAEGGVKFSHWNAITWSYASPVWWIWWSLFGSFFWNSGHLSIWFSRTMRVSLLTLSWPLCHFSFRGEVRLGYLNSIFPSKVPIHAACYHCFILYFSFIGKNRRSHQQSCYLCWIPSCNCLQNVYAQQRKLLWYVTVTVFFFSFLVLIYIYVVNVTVNDSVLELLTVKMVW